MKTDYCSQVISYEGLAADVASPLFLGVTKGYPKRKRHDTLRSIAYDRPQGTEGFKAITKTGIDIHIIHGLRPIRKKGRKIITNGKYTYLTRRVGSTTYKVRVHFRKVGQETMEDKIIRLIRNDALDSKAECGIMELPQMSRQPERSTT